MKALRRAVAVVVAAVEAVVAAVIGDKGVVACGSRPIYLTYCRFVVS